MGTTNEEAIARSTQAKSQPVSVTGSGSSARGESQVAGDKQERDYRTHSSESSIFSTGTTVTGGMLDHLIDEYCDQVAAKKDEARRINDEVKRLESRIQEFKALREELKKQTEDNS
jgi:chromosome segregation ATPase